MAPLKGTALLGATGALGRSLGRALSARGQSYRAVGRTLLPLEMRFKADPLAEIVLWDIAPVKKQKPDTSIEQALTGVDTAVYLVGVPLWQFADHLPLTRRVLAAAQAAGVRRLLLVSSYWAYGVPQTERVAEDHPLAAMTVKGGLRREQEEMVLSARAAGLETAILRVGDFYGPNADASYLWSAFNAARKHTHAQLLSPADTPHDFVFVPDAAETIARFLDQDGGWGHAWNLAGAGATTLREMSERIFAAAGLPPAYAVPPRWKLRLVAMMNPYVRELREMQYLLEAPVLLDDARLAALLGGLSKTSYDDGIRVTLGLAG